MAIDRHKDSFIWVAKPSLDCVNYICEEMHFAGLTKQCVVSQVLFASLLVKLEKEGFATDQQLFEQLQQITRRTAELGLWAADEALGGHTNMNTHTVVNMWNYTYSSIQDTVSIILFHDLEARARVLRIVGRKSFPQEPDEFELGSLAQRFLGESLKSQPAQISFPISFAELELHVDATKRDFSLLEEIRCTRNCIVHNSGFVDDYARQRVPSLRYGANEAIRVNEEGAEKYLEHMSNFVSALSDAALASRYCPKANGNAEHQ